MENQADGEKGKMLIKGIDHEVHVEQAVLTPDGSIAVPQCEAKLTAVDVADVDLLLCFSDDTYVIISNGALDAVTDPDQQVVFKDNDDSVQDPGHFKVDHQSTLGELFKMVGISNPAKAGSLRVVSGNVDALKPQEDVELPKAQESQTAASSDVAFFEQNPSPAPIFNPRSSVTSTGKGPGPGASSPSDQIIIPEDPVVPTITPRPTVYRAGQVVISEELQPTISLDANITADDIINIVESGGNVTISGTVGGDAQPGDTITLSVNGKDYTATTDLGRTFSVEVVGADLVADVDRVIESTVTTYNGVGTPYTATTNEGYSVDISAPGVTVGQSFNYAENQTAGATVATVVATDVEGVTGYRFGNGTSTSDDGFFSITADGRIVLTAEGAAAGAASNDFETGANSFTLGVQARDAAGNWSDTIDVALNVTDLDETAPSVLAGQTLNYAENQIAGGVVGTVLTSDDLGVSGFRFSDTNTTTSANGYFVIAVDGRIHITAAGVAAGAQNDFETAPNTFTYGIQARGAGGIWSEVVNVTLNITDVDENPPAVTSGQSFSYAENQLIGAVVGTVVATDDVGVTGYRFSNGTTISDDGYFTIANDGKITLTPNGVAAGAASNDFESGTNSFTHAVQARDVAGNWSAAENVTISVTDVDENPPDVIPGQIFSYAENQISGSVVGTVSATDDVGITDYRFSATGTAISADGYFTIANDGKITLTLNGVAVGAASNDFETGANSFTHAVEARDAAGNWSTAVDVTLNVTDVFETASAVIPGQTFSYAENQVAGAVVGTVAAIGSEGVTGFRFSDTGTTTSVDGYFEINQYTGQITLIGAGEANNFEAGVNSFTYGVQAQNSVGNWSIAENVTLNVTNVNEAPSDISLSASTVNENFPTGTVIATFTATDPDLAAPGFTGPFTYSLIPGDGTNDADNGLVTIVGNELRVNGTIDFETNPSLVIYVQVTDVGGLSYTKSLTVAVNDVNDVPVAYTAAETTEENTVLVGNVPAATDVDGTVAGYQLATDVAAGTLTFNADGSYSFDPGSAFDDLAAGASREVSFSYTATDNNGAQSAPATVTITVTGSNDAPVVSAASASTEENTILSGNVPAATDVDGTIAGYQLATDVLTGTIPVDGSGYALFTINSVTGEISLTAEGAAFIDYEGTKSYSLNVVASDGISDSNIKTVTINLSDVNDNSPVITTSEIHSVAENTGFSVGLTSTDSDTVGTNPANFSIVGGVDKDLFTIDTSGNLTLAAQNHELPADNDGDNIYEVTIRASDGQNSTDKTITVSVANIEDQAPVIAPGQSYSYEENPTGPVATVAATDDIGVTEFRFVYADGVTTSTTSEDNLFSINATTGQITVIGDAAKISDGSDTFVLNVQARDAAGNVDAENVTLKVVDVLNDAVRPTVVSFTVTDPNPLPIPPDSPRINEPSTVTIQFSEPVRVFDPAVVFDLTHANGTLGIFSSADGGITWTSTFTPEAGEENLGNYITLNAGSISDMRGNTNEFASNSNPFNIDTVKPTPSITLDPITTANDDDVVNIAEAAGNVTITGKVAGEFNAGDVVTLTLAAGTSQVSTFIGAVDVNGNFSIAVAGSALVGDLDKKIQASIATEDAAGNHNTVDRVLPSDPDVDYTVDVTAPTPTITLDANITPDDIVNAAEAANYITITGTVGGDAQVGDTVRLTINNKTIDGLVALAADNVTKIFSIAVAGSDLVADADKIIEARINLNDAAGNTGAATDFEGYSCDAVAPPRPVIRDIDPASDTGASNSDSYTSDKTPTLRGYAEPQSSVKIYLDGSATAFATVTADANGEWNFTPSSSLSEGSHSFTATATDAAGNVSSSSIAFVVTIDSVAPDKPTIDRVADNVEPGTDDITNNGFTNDPTPTLYGTAEANSKVEIYDGTIIVGTVTAGADGKWSFTTAELPEDSTHSYSVKAADKAGNISVSSDPFVLNIQTSVDTPTIGGVDDNVGLVQGILSSGSSTDDMKPTLFGTAEAGSIIKIYDNNAPTAIATVTADSDGKWSYTPSSDLQEGSSHSFTVTAQDTAGNVSEKSADFVLLIDGSVPAPAITSVVDDVAPVIGSLTSGNYTNDATPTFSGLAEANSTVQIFDTDGITIIGGAVANGSGVWTITPEVALGQGTHTFTATATDAAGNVSAPSAAFTLNVDTVKPDSPSLSVNDNLNPVQGAVSNGGYTNDTTPTLTISAEAGTTIFLFDNGVEIANTVSTGAWVYTPPTALSNATTHSYTLTATDAAGNVSDTSSPYVIHIDNFIAAQTITAWDDDSGLRQITNNYTNDTTPIFKGSAGEFCSIVLRNTTTSEQYSFDTAADGTWEFSSLPALGEGSFNFVVTATDRAGNTRNSVSLTLNIDTTNPGVPSITGANDNSGTIQGNVVNGGVTNDLTPTLSGTSEPYSTIQIFNDGILIATPTITTNGSGIWSYTPSTSLINGTTYSYTVTATDRAGNVGMMSTPYVITIDGTAPAQPTITSVYDDFGTFTGVIANGGNTNDNTPTLTGTAEAGSTVTIKDGTAILATTVTAADGTWTATTPALTLDGIHSLTVTATDAAGNTSVASATRTLNLDATKPNTPVLSSVTDNVGSITGSLASGAYSDDTQLALTGTAEAGSSITIKDGTNIWTTTATDGNWSFTPTLGEGLHNLSITATDAVGNESDATTFSVTIDTTTPGKPTIASVTDNVAPVGYPDAPVNIVNGGFTNDTTPTLTGKAEANSTITITAYCSTDGTSQAFATTANVSGDWSLELPDNLVEDKAYSFTVTATDAAGNTSAASDAFTLTVKTTVPAPAIINVTDNVASDGTPTAPADLVTDDYTNDTTPTLTGTAVAGTTITIYDNGDLLDTVTADGNGDWTYTSTVLSQGTHSFTVMATDGAGNVSDYSSAFVLHVDTDINTPTISSAVANGGYTNDTTPTLSGDAEAGSTVRIYDGINPDPVATVIADISTGDWSYTSSVLDDGTSHSFTVMATDAAGNFKISSPYVLNIDTTPPDAPVISVTDDVNPRQGSVANNGYTNDSTPTLSGTGEEGDTVTIKEGGNTLISIVIGATGLWSYTTAALANGSIHSYTVTVTDQAGNISVPSTYTLHIDTAAPVAPTVALAVDGNFDTTGALNLGGIESGAVVEYSSDGINWLPTPPDLSAVGANSVYVRQVDQAGNPSAGTLFEFTRGTTLTGDGNNNILVGGSGNDTLNGGGGNDTLYGSGGDDILIGGAGSDKLYGGSGSDTVSYADSIASITASLAAGSGSAGDAAGDNYFGIENLTGGAGNDSLIGNGLDNKLVGGAGDDLLLGGFGADIFIGGDGITDTSIDTVSYYGSSSAVNANLETGLGSGGDATGDTYVGIENLIGGSGDDTLTGDIHDNILTGGVGADTLTGGEGTDTASYANSTNTGGVVASIDSSLWGFHTGDAIGDKLFSIENLIGTSYNDTLFGDSKSNMITGGSGDDTMYGYAGNDTIYADQGHDKAYGDIGNDTFHVTSILGGNSPTLIDGGADTDSLVLHGLGGSYDLTTLVSADNKIENMEILNIRGDSVNTTIAITGQDILNMVDPVSGSAQLTVLADNGDTLDLTAFAPQSENCTVNVIDPGVHTEYVISDGSGEIARIQWLAAVA